MGEHTSAALAEQENPFVGAMMALSRIDTRFEREIGFLDETDWINIKALEKEAMAAITSLSVRIYRGFHIRADFSNKSADSFIDGSNTDASSLERTMNHIHLFDVFPYVADTKSILNLAHILYNSWRDTLLTFDKRYEVILSDGYGPEITFYFNRS